MQLTGQSSIRGALTALTAALLGSGVVVATENNKLESSLLLYSETNRVQAAEGLFSFTRTFKGDRILNARLTLDGLTGSSPNGATPSSAIQTFTKPSGNGSYAVKPGEVPLDETFKDTRVSFDGSLSHPLNRLMTVVIGAHFSKEHDYSSLGANAGLSRDFNRKNTNISVSAAYSRDLFSPLGGVPNPMTAMVPPTDDDGESEGEDNNHEGEDDDHEGGGSGEGKNVFDAVLGITQVLDRKTVLRLNYSTNYSSGYLNDPYKILSIVQGPNDSEPGEPVDYIYEARPDNRTKQAVYAEVRRFISGHYVDFSYRYFWDNWGITSHTFDLHYRLPIFGDHALLPHIRYYKQTGADFYRSYLLNGSSLPEFASADYRLAPFHAITVGLQYLFPIAPGTRLSLGAEYYRQSGDLSPPGSMGVLSQSELFPDMKAVMVRAGFSFDF